MCESRGQRRVLGLPIVRRFGLGRRPVPDRLEDPAVVEPVDPLEGCELHCFEAPPRTAGSNHLGLLQPDDGLGQSYEGSDHDSLAPGSSHWPAGRSMLTVVRIANAPDRLLDAGLARRSV